MCWLNEAKEKLDPIESSHAKNKLINEFDQSFIRTITKLLESSDFDNLIKEFIEKQVEAIQLGNICLSEQSFSRKYIFNG